MRSSQLLIFLLHLSVILESLKGLIGSMMLPLLPSGLLPMVHQGIEDCLPHHLRSTLSSRKALRLASKENKNYGKDQKPLLVSHGIVDAESAITTDSVIKSSSSLDPIQQLYSIGRVKNYEVVWKQLLNLLKLQAGA
jgi:hypothetical protein